MRIKQLAVLALLVLGMVGIAHVSFADPSPMPSPSAMASLVAPVQTAVSAPADSSNADFLNQVFSLIQAFGGLSWVGKISALVLLLIASMKVSFLAPLWAKLGEAQVFIAPFLGILAGVISMKPFSWAGLCAYLFAGAGAILLHEILDGAKAIPGLGSVYVSVINFAEGILGGSAPKQS